MNNKKLNSDEQTENSKLLLNRVKKAISKRKSTRSARPIPSLYKMKSVRPMVVGMTAGKAEETEE